MCLSLEEFVSTLRDFVRGVDASSLAAQRAMRFVELFSEVERLAGAGRTLAAGRVQQTRAWRATGSSSLASWMADRMGGTLGQATATLNTAERLQHLPATREALLAGDLSATQAAEISAAAIADRAAEPALVALAANESVAALRERCRDIRAAAAGDEDATERIRRGRYFRHWIERDGAIRLDGRLAPDDAAPLIATVAARTEKIVAEARRAGQLERREAYAADALVSLVDGAGAPGSVVHVHVSQTALERGRTVAGETCRIEGVGPIGVAAARRLASRGVLKILQIDGTDVRRVAHAGRVIPARIRTALEARDPTCVVPGCNRRYGLEIDHVVPISLGGLTCLENVARLCRWHHAQKTHHGWRLGGGPGQWTWTRGRRREGSSPPRGG